MIVRNLGENVKVTVLSGPVAAGQTEIDSSALDMSGFEGVLILTQFGTITSGSVVTVAIQDGATASPTSAVSGASRIVPDTKSNDVTLHDISANKVDRYLRVVVTRTTQDAVLSGIIAIQYGARSEPPTNDSATVDYLTSFVV